MVLSDSLEMTKITDKYFSFIFFLSHLVGFVCGIFRGHYLTLSHVGIMAQFHLETFCLYISLNNNRTQYNISYNYLSNL